MFDIGDKVVYPHHGAAVVERRETKEAFGKKQEYLVLRLAYGDLTLMVPADNTDGVGLREVINDEEVEEVFAVLRKKEARMPTNWSRRYKNHSEKLRSGDIYQVAEVVRNLSIRDKDKGLSAGEKRMLQPGPPDPGVRADLRPRGGRGGGRGPAQRGAALSRQGSVWAIVVAGGLGPPVRRPQAVLPARRAVRWPPGRSPPPARWPTASCWWSRPAIERGGGPTGRRPDGGRWRHPGGLGAGRTGRRPRRRRGDRGPRRRPAPGRARAVRGRGGRGARPSADGAIPVLAVADTLKRVAGGHGRSPRSTARGWSRSRRPRPSTPPPCGTPTAPRGRPPTTPACWSGRGPRCARCRATPAT